MSNSCPPILTVPEGRMTFCALTALMTSVGESPRAWSSWLLISIEIHSLLAAVRVRDRGAGNRHQLNPKEVQCKIIELLLRKIGSAQAETQDRDVGSAETQNQRGCFPRRQLF